MQMKNKKENHYIVYRELKLDGAIVHFPKPLRRLKTGHFTTYTVE